MAELLSDIDARSIRIPRVSWSTPTPERTLDECNRLLLVVTALSQNGGRDSQDAAVIYRERCVPMLQSILRARWDMFKAAGRWPEVISALERMTAPTE